MYRCSNGQISLADFKQPVGMNLKESNRWVKKAQTIPWLEIEKRYAALFTNRKGNVVKPLRLALGACIIQAEYGYTCKGNQRLLPFKAAHIADLSHELRTEGLPRTVHLHNHRVLRQRGSKMLHFCAVGFYTV